MSGLQIPSVCEFEEETLKTWTLETCQPLGLEEKSFQEDFYKRKMLGPWGPLLLPCIFRFPSPSSIILRATLKGFPWHFLCWKGFFLQPQRIYPSVASNWSINYALTWYNYKIYMKKTKQTPHFESHRQVLRSILKGWDLFENIASNAFALRFSQFVLYTDKTSMFFN